MAAIGDGAAFCQGFVNPVNGKKISIGLEAEGVGSVMDVAVAIRPCGAEADFLLADFGVALWEQEFPVLIQLVILCPGEAWVVFVHLAGGHLELPIKIGGSAVAASVILNLANRLDVPGRAFLREENGIAVLAAQCIQRIGAAGQCVLLCVRQLLPVNAEAGLESGGFRVAADGHHDAVVTGGESAVVQRPVNVMAIVANAIVSALGKPDSRLYHIIVRVRAFHRLP